MTSKERIIEQLDDMNEAQLVTLEQQIKRTKRAQESEFEKQERIKRQLEALHDVAGMLSDPEEYAEFEKYARRRSSIL